LAISKGTRESFKRALSFEEEGNSLVLDDFTGEKKQDQILRRICLGLLRQALHGEKTSL
jgi:hypothetical protein